MGREADLLVNLRTNDSDQLGRYSSLALKVREGPEQSMPTSPVKMRGCICRHREFEDLSQFSGHARSHSPRLCVRATMTPSRLSMAAPLQSKCGSSDVT